MKQQPQEINNPIPTTPVSTNIVTATVTTKKALRLNLREKPTPQSKILKMLDHSTVVEVISQTPDNGFYKVKYLDITGFVKSDFLKIDK